MMNLPWYHACRTRTNTVLLITVNKVNDVAPDDNICASLCTVMSYGVTEGQVFAFAEDLNKGGGISKPRIKERFATNCCNCGLQASRED
jgi:hypothetical protein